MARLLHLPEMHVPEAFRHAKAWYWTAAAVGVAIIVAYLLIVYVAPIEGAANWDFAA